MGTFFDLDYSIKPYTNFIYLTKYEYEETDKNIMYTPEFHITYEITVSDLTGFSANLNITNKSEQDIYDYQYGTYSKIEKDEFTVANLTISKKIVDINDYGSMTLKGEIQNLFDSNYEYVQGLSHVQKNLFY
jgi:vitamin B12 transporter